MYLKKLLKNFQQLFLYKEPQPIVKKKDIGYQNQITAKKLFKLATFGELNPDKIFYIIKRDPGAGLFSNFVFIMNHLRIADHHNFIPYVDMENWPSWYSEIEAINNTKNSWEYYFKQVSKFSKEEVYKSKNIIITRNDFYEDFSKNLLDNKIFKDLQSKYIVIQDHILKDVNDFYIKNFKNKKVIGIYIRGGETKRMPKHGMPPTIKQIDKSMKKITKNKNFDFIFLSTKEKIYLDYFKKNFNDKLITYNSFKEEKEDCFQIYPRKNHRFLLGKEIFVEMLILSKADYLVYNISNVSLMSLFFNQNINQSRYYLDNGLNHKNKFIAQIYWYLKLLLPQSLGGFKENILKNIK